MNRAPARRATVVWGFLLTLVAYWAIVLGFVVPEYDGGGIHLSDEVAAGGPLLVGLLLVPIVMVTMALLSHQVRPGRTVVYATVVSGAVGLAVAVVTTIPAGVVAGMGAGAAISLNLPDRVDVKKRWWYLAAAVTVSLILHALQPQVSLFVSAVLPVVSVGLADGVGVTERD